MCPMQRVRLAVLFLIVAALFAGTSAPAVGGDSKNTVIQLAATGAELNALGQAALSNLRTTWYRQGGVTYQVRLRVTSDGLTPHATYVVLTNVWDYETQGFVAWDFRASATGGGVAGGSIRWSNWQHLGIAVLRVDETPEGIVYTTVLTGGFPF